jgi:hypothetical protein
MVSQILKSVDSEAGEGEVAVIALLTKTTSLRADDAMTISEAADLANMVKIISIVKLYW